MPKREPSEDDIARWRRALDEAQIAFEAQNPGRARVRAARFDYYAGPLCQGPARVRLAVLRAQFEAGDPRALLEAVGVCARCELTIPQWASAEFMTAIGEVAHARVASWDRAFGKPWEGKHLNKLEQRLALQPDVYFRVRKIQDTDPEQAIDRSLFERVAEEFKIGRTQCEELYYRQRRANERLHAHILELEIIERMQPR